VFSIQRKIIPLLLLFLLSGCGLETKTLTEFYEQDFEEVTKIQIMDGNTGFKKEILDKKEIDDFLNKIKDIRFIPEDDQEDRDGTRYSITFYLEEEATFSFALNKVNDHYYYTKPDIYPIVDGFYKTIGL
jgi:hypothetical protein